MNFLSKLFGKNQLELIEDKNGKHIFGGEIPEDFVIPENRFLANFQYIGKISNSDKNFQWLPFDLDLICPILTDFEYIFLDYNDPKKPKLIFPQNSESIRSAYDEIDQNSKIIYEAKKFSLKEFGGINEDNEFDVFGVTGKPQPNFEDEPVVYPKCPLTNSKMDFVVQLFSNRHLKTTSKNFVSKSDYEEKIHQHMNFWCDGSLKVFISPKSKIVCYSIQNT